MTNKTAVVKIDPTTGTQSIVSSGGNLTNINGIAIVASGTAGLRAGDIYVTEVPLPGALLKIVRIDPATGTQNVVSSGGNLAGGSMGIAIGANGNIFVNVGGNGVSKIIQIDPMVGFQTIVASIAGLGYSAIAVGTDGNVFVTTGTQIIQVNPVSRTQTVIVNFQLILAIAIDVSGDLVALEGRVGSTTGSVVRISLSGGAMTVVSSGIDLFSVAIALSNSIAVDFTGSGTSTTATSTTATTYHVFPQFADGRFTDGSYFRTTLMISNPDRNTGSSCALQLRGLTISGFDLTYRLAPAGWVIQSTTGIQSLQTGYATLQCSSKVEAQLLYSFYASNATKVGEAAVFSSPAAPTTQVLADTREGARLGLAIANDSDQSTTYTISAGDANGAIIATTSVTLGARSAQAAFLDQVLPIPSGYYGSVSVSSNSGTASLIGLRFTGNVFSTIPQTIRP